MKVNCPFGDLARRIGTRETHRHRQDIRQRSERAVVAPRPLLPHARDLSFTRQRVVVRDEEILEVDAPTSVADRIGRAGSRRCHTKPHSPKQQAQRCGTGNLLRQGPSRERGLAAPSASSMPSFPWRGAQPAPWLHAGPKQVAALDARPHDTCTTKHKQGKATINTPHMENSHQNMHQYDKGETSITHNATNNVTILASACPASSTPAMMAPISCHSACWVTNARQRNKRKIILHSKGLVTVITCLCSEEFMGDGLGAGTCGTECENKTTTRNSMHCL